MSRIVVYVLVPQARKDLEAAVHEVLWPYHNECELELEVTEEHCSCMNEEGIPDPECWDCDGDGVVTSSWNPNSQWDWCLIGDWEWDIPLVGCLSCPCDLQLNGGAAPMKNLDVEKLQVPDAVVTPDGEWHEDFYHPSHWLNTFKQLLRTHEEATLVGVLCHQ